MPTRLQAEGGMEGPMDVLRIGGGQVEALAPGVWRLDIPTDPGGYADAQIDDYRRLRRRDFLWRPPAVMSLEARASLAAPRGTLGFGFWNDPFTLSLGQRGAGRRLPAAPRAAWFFYASPPSVLALNEEGPDHGWQAMVIDAPAIPSLLLAVPAAAGLVGLNLPGTRRSALRAARRFLRAALAALPHRLDEWHGYTIAWREDGVRFVVDGEEVLAAPAPRPPLGFVAWIDNQYAVLSLERGLRFGVIGEHPAQNLEIRNLHLSSTS